MSEVSKSAPEQQISTSSIVTGKNPRGIPEVVFIDDVTQFLKRIGTDAVETPIGAFNELYSKYKLMETNLDKAKQSMKEKVPEIERSLDLVRHLQERQSLMKQGSPVSTRRRQLRRYLASLEENKQSVEMNIEYLYINEEKNETVKTNYSLADTVFAKAQLKCDGRVCIWLGASVMVEYTYEEAITLLSSNLENALEKQATTQEDLEFLRNQSITVEVNMARLYNYDVLRRRKTQELKKTNEEGKAAA